MGVVSTSTAAARKPGKTLVGTWAGAAFSAAGRRWRVRPAPARGTLEGMEFVTRLVATAIATAVAVWLVPGINLTASDTQGKILTLLGVALFHDHTLAVGLTGLVTISIYKLIFTGFKAGEGFVGLAGHFQHEWVVLANLFCLLMGFALLSRH